MELGGTCIHSRPSTSIHIGVIRLLDVSFMVD